MRRVVLVAWMTIGLMMSGAVVALAETRVALVIGNSSYENVGALENPVNDASDLAVALEGLGFDVYLGLDLTQAEMSGLTETFSQASTSADVSLFFYAGHGFQVSGQNYLVPVDARIASADDILTQTVSMTGISRQLEKSGGLRLVFLDACRDNPFGGSDIDAQLSSGLARMGDAANFMVSYATQPDNVAYDGTGRNSFFTEALLSHIYTPGQDVGDLMIAVRKDVLAATGGRQIPWENSSLTRQFTFDTSPVTASEETLLYQVAVSADDPQLMQLYVDRYPQGSHVGDVVAYLETADQVGTRTRKLTVGDTDAQAERLWQLAQRSRMRPLLEFYLEQYPDGAHAGQARRLIQSIPDKEDTTPGGICERLTTHPRDRTAKQPGVPFAQLKRNAISAIQACSAAAAQSPELPHYTALLARATIAAGDVDRAVQLYHQAAERGDLRAMVSLAQLYDTGTGVVQDQARALRLNEQAADAGSLDAKINLAVALFEGAGIAQDTDRAIALLKQAADQGSAKATFNLGVLAQEGVADTPDQALTYFQRAAREGEVQGYRAAAILLDEGRGVQSNPEMAADLLLRGAAEDNGTIVQQLTENTKEWSPQTIRAVQSRLKAAGVYVSAIDGLPGPGFTSALDQWRNGGFAPEVLQN
jgi:uncharacterized caspase-like protein